jgi:acetyltransferase-like isoleucine patch superfamily enzyme
MPIRLALLDRLPPWLVEMLRSGFGSLRVLWRTVAYPVRFAGIDVCVHPTAWVARRAILRCTGGGRIEIGKHCEIHDYAVLDASGGLIQMGEFCSLNPFSIIYGHGGTIIGNYVRIAAHTVIVSANHEFRSKAHLHESGVIARGIAIGDDVWLGAGTRILDGVTIGSRSVVGAGAVVTRPVPSGCVAIGVPARAAVISNQAPIQLCD